MGLNFESLTEATSGAVGGLLSTIILYPLDTCKTKYQAEARCGASRKYRSLLDVFREAIEKRQILSLYQGLGTKNLQSVISQFIYFFSYSYFKQFYLKRAKLKQMGMGANIVVGAVAGACTVVLTQPLDTASSLMQTSTFGKSKGLWATLTEGSWKEGYAGIDASLVLTSNPAIQYTVFEQLKERLLRSKAGGTLVSGDNLLPASPIVLSAFQAFLLGALSKTCATIVTYPAIRTKVMLQAAESDENKEQQMNAGPGGPVKPPKKLFDTIHQIWREEGIWGFYKGLQAQILKTVLGAALMLMIKEKTSQFTWAVMLALRRWVLAGKSKLQQVKLPPKVTAPVNLAAVALASRATSR